MRNYIVELLWVLVAMGGAVAKYLNDYVRKKVTFSWSKFIATIVIGSFSGWMFGKFMAALGAADDLAMIGAGLGGAMGFNAIEFLWDVVRSAISKTQSQGETHDK
jgi:hypothetical protein